MRIDTRRLIPHVLAAAALFGLPACSLSHAAIPGRFQPGPTPQSSAIFCDIEPLGTGWDHTSRVCFDAAPVATQTAALPLTVAALALNAGQSSANAIDKSPAAVGRCGANGEIVTYVGPFPKGTPVCLNCGTQIDGDPYANANQACVAACRDIVRPTESGLGLTDADALAFCNAHSRASTNLPITGCPMGFEGACSEGGTLRTDFTDPRMFPEPVMWADLIGVAAGGTASNDLMQTSPTTTPFQSGAASSQWVGTGDAFVEFAPGETNKTHVIGFSQLAPGATPPDPDTDPTPADIAYAFDLGNDGRVYILNAGTLVPGSDIAQSWGMYAAGDRFRLHLIDRGDGTYDFSFTKIVGACPAGMPCNEHLFTEIPFGGAGPFRVDASFHDNGATLQNVLLMRIIPQ